MVDNPYRSGENRTASVRPLCYDEKKDFRGNYETALCASAHSSLLGKISAQIPIPISTGYRRCVGGISEWQECTVSNMRLGGQDRNIRVRREADEYVLQVDGKEYRAPQGQEIVVEW